MKKVLMVLLALAMVFSMAGVVSADDTTQNSQTSGDNSAATPESTQLPSDEQGMELEYDIDPGFTLTIPVNVNFKTGLKSVQDVSVTNAHLPQKHTLAVVVESTNEFNLVTGSGLTVSKIPYSVTRYDGADVKDKKVVLEVSEGVNSNSAQMTFSTTQDNIDSATLSGKHTDTLTFTASVSADQDADTIIKIGNLEVLKAFAADVNSGNTYAGKTVLLTADIDLLNEEWTPIGNTDDKKFQGTFDGQGHTIKNLKITSEDGSNVGFFGILNGNVKNVIFDGAVLTPKATDVGYVGVAAGLIHNTGSIDGVTVKNAKIEGNHYLGGIVGSAYGTVTNCKVIDSEITAVPNEVSAGTYDNGDKVGGIIGFMQSDCDKPISGNTVTSVTLKAYRDVGGVAGAAEGSYVTENTVKDVLIIVDQETNNYGNKDTNAGEIFGPRFEDNTVDSSNTHEDVYIWIYGEPIEKISSVAALRAFAMDVDAGNDYEGKTVTLEADLDLYAVDANGARISFDPIGDKSAFKGTFDGQGHTIENLYQSGWAFGYYWGSYGSIGLFGNVEDATIKDVVISGAEAQIEGGDIGGIVGSATGTCVFEDIVIEDSDFGTYNNGIGGIIGWSGEGDYTFRNIEIAEDVVLGGLWGSFDSSIGGVVGQAEPGATYNFENVDVACRLDAYNDVTASYKYYLYRMTGMLIGRMEETTTIDGKNYPDMTKYNINCEDVTVTYNDWANYHYCVVSGKTAWRHEPGFTYGGIPADHDHSTCDPTMHNLELPFDGLFGGAQYGVNPITEYDGVTVIYNNK